MRPVLLTFAGSVSYSFQFSFNFLSRDMPLHRLIKAIRPFGQAFAVRAPAHGVSTASQQRLGFSDVPGKFAQNGNLSSHVSTGPVFALKAARNTHMALPQWAAILSVGETPVKGKSIGNV